MNVTEKDFRLPGYNEIPDVGLYLDQVSKYITSCLGETTGIKLTPSMISNYVKQKLLDHPVKKQYGREQIATLLIIALSKTVLSLDEIRVLLKTSGDGDKDGSFYTLFAEGLEEALAIVRGAVTDKKSFRTDQKKDDLIWTLLITIAFRLTLGQMLDSEK